MRLGAVALAAAPFVNPLFLSGLALVAVPILIHILSRRRFRIVPWGAMRFLLEAERENRRRLRFEQWLLLAARCLIMALLALLVARPFVQSGVIATLLGAGEPARRLVVIDDSASLAWRSGATQTFAAVRDAAGRLLSWIAAEAPEDHVTVLLASRADEPLVEAAPIRGLALDDLLGSIRRLEPAAVPAKPQDVMTRLAARIAAEEASVRADVYILSDFQRAEWLRDAGASCFAPLRETKHENLRCLLITAVAGPRDNIGIVALEALRPQTSAGVPAVLSATIANFSGAPLSGASVRVEVDGAPAAPVVLNTLRPYESAAVTFEALFSQVGYAQALVALDSPDGLDLDDRRRLNLHVKPALRVLLAGGDSSAAPTLDETRFVRNALAPAGAFNSGVEVELVAPETLDATDLERYDLALLCDLAAPRPTVVAALRRFVERGGGMAIFVGPRVVPQAYNRALGAGADGLLPALLDEPRDSPEPGGASLIAVSEHPIVAMLPRQANSTSGPRVWRYLATAPDEQAQTLARYGSDQGDAALLERGVGQGHVLLFTSTIDLAWNDWPRTTDGSYVVTLLEIAQRLARPDPSPRAFVAGERIFVPQAPQTFDPGARFRTPGFPVEPAVDGVASDEDSSDAGARWIGPVAREVGIYFAELQRRGGDVELRPLAVNLDPTESDLRSATGAELVRALGPVRTEFIRASDAFLQDHESARRELWRSIAAALLLLLLAEQSIAWWFGRPQRHAAGGALPSLARWLNARWRRLRT